MAEALYEELERLRSLLARTGESIWCWGMVEPVDPEWPLNRQVAGLLNAVLLDCNDTAVAGFGKQRRDEVIGRRREELWGPADAATIRIHEHFVRSGYDAEGELEFPYPDGTKRTFLNRGFAVMRAGCIVAIWGTAQDITDKKRLQQEVLQAQKLEVVGRLAASLAHDFNNLLTVILGALELAETEQAYDPELLAAALAAGRRSSDLTRQLLGVSRGRSDRPQALDLVALLDELRPVLGRLAGPGVELVYKIQREALNVFIDRTAIEQVLMNLIVNARDAVAGRGLVEVEATRQHPWVTIVVRDSGPGMSPAVALRAFEPFFTTKAEGAGTGLGLATCRRVIDAAAGTLAILPIERGCAIEIKLPWTEAVPRVTSPAPLTRGSGELVLLVDDYDAVREVYARALRTLGYRVVAAGSGSEARIAFDSESFDAVVCDVQLGDTTGTELLAEFRRSEPELPAVLMSGIKDVDLHGDEQHFTTFLAKPASPAVLARALSTLLGRPRSGLLDSR
jgi:two-component system, cell cycle sensor histidine kinase and response regulator CckA